MRDERPRKTARRFFPDRGVHFLTFSCYQRRPFFDDPRLRDEFAERLGEARARHRFRLLAWVVMPEHVHMMLLPTTLLDERGSALPAVLIGVKKPLAADAIARWRAARGAAAPARFWQPGGGFDRNVRSWDELVREARYIHQNPATRGLAAHATDWAWSSARWFAGDGHSLLEVDSATVDRHEFPGTNHRMFLGEPCSW